MITNMIKEYESLRNEILQKIQLTNTLLNFAVTTAVAILAFAVESKNKNALLFLVPFCVLIPISVRIAYYRDSMAKISAYMNVFLEEKIEGFDWETRNVLLDEKNMNKKYDFLRNTECLFIGIVCTGLYFYYYIMYKQQICKIIDVALPIIFFSIEIFITFRRKSFVKERKKWISEWQKLKNKKASR